MNAICTEITVRVIARDGKFLGDDIGGASITIRDAQTKELLAQGITSGGSGPNKHGGVMCVSLRRGEPIPDTGASAFTTFLPLDRPRRIEVTAYGPLGARQSANTVSATQWIYPGKGITGGNGFLLELPGLIVQIVHPPTHYTPASLPSLTIQANVAMMCGCPIDYKTAAVEESDLPRTEGRPAALVARGIRGGSADHRADGRAGFAPARVPEHPARRHARPVHRRLECPAAGNL